MSDLHRYGFAYGHPRCPLPPSKYDDPRKAEFVNELTALRRQRSSPTTSQSHNNASARNGLSAGQSVPSAAPRISGDCREYVAPLTQFGIPSRRTAQEVLPTSPIPLREGGRACKVCGGGIPEMENGRKVRTDTWTCGPACRRKDAQRARDRRRSAKRAAARAAKAAK